jgi:hypothetical protein
MHTFGRVGLVLFIASIIGVASWATLATVTYNWAREHSIIKRDGQRFIPTLFPLRDLDIDLMSVLPEGEPALLSPIHVEASSILPRPIG